MRDPSPRLIAAPVPSPARYGGRAVYFSDLAVRADAPFERLEDTYGGRIGWTLPDSQSGCYALRWFLQQQRAARPDPARPLYGEVVPRLVNPRGVIQALLDGRIDVGPLDSFSQDLIRHTEPDIAQRIRVIAPTPPTAMPPFVCTDANATDDALHRLLDQFVAMQPAD